MLCHHNLEEYLTAYLGGAGLRGDPNGPVYRTIGRRTGQLTRTVGSPAETAGDALGDVDAFIEQYEEETREVPKIAAEIARRLLSAGRAGRHGSSSNEQTLGTVEVTDYHLGHRGCVIRLGHAQTQHRISWRNLGNVGTATADTADDA